MADSFGFRQILLLLMLCASAIAHCGCTKYDSLDSPPPVIVFEDSRLTVAEAKSIFATSFGNAVGACGRSGRCAISYDIRKVFWDEVSSYHNRITGQDVVEAPFLTGSTYRFFSSRGAQTTEFPASSHKILVVRDDEGRTGVFFMTLIADLAEEKDENDAFSDYSGLVIYSRLSGAIVRADRYEDGVLVSEASIYAMAKPLDAGSWGKTLATVTGRLKVIKTDRRAVTRSGDGGMDDWWDCDSTAIDIEGSICIADSTEVDPFDPFDPFADLDYGDPFADDPDEPDPGCGGCGGGGGVRPTPQNPPASSQYAGIHISGGTAAQIDNLKKVFTDSKVSDYKPVKALLDRLDKSKVSIKIMDKVIVDKVSASASCSPPNSSGRIIISVSAGEVDDPSDYCWEIYEELFHAYQYQTSPGWKAGDRELEAKVWISVLSAETPISFCIDDRYSEVFYKLFIEYKDNHFKDYSDALFDEALSVLRAYPFMYRIDKYPISTNISKTERFKHIKSLR